LSVKLGIRFSHPKFTFSFWVELQMFVVYGYRGPSPIHSPSCLSLVNLGYLGGRLKDGAQKFSHGEALKGRRATCGMVCGGKFSLVGLRLGLESFGEIGL
jgi:hypothetical protein